MFIRFDFRISIILEGDAINSINYSLTYILKIKWNQQLTFAKNVPNCYQEIFSTLFDANCIFIQTMVAIYSNLVDIFSR